MATDKKSVIDTKYLYGDWLKDKGNVLGKKMKKKKAEKPKGFSKRKTPKGFSKRMKILQARAAKGQEGKDAVEEFYERVDRAYSAPDKIAPRDKGHKAWRKKRMDRKKGGGL